MNEKPLQLAAIIHEWNILINSLFIMNKIESEHIVSISHSSGTYYKSPRNCHILNTKSEMPDDDNKEGKFLHDIPS